MSQRPRPVALTIAGSDSGGGAGIQADLKTFHQFGVFGTSALTAVTAQDTRGVRDVHLIPPDVVRSQIDAVMEDLQPSAVKSGMLGTAELASVVASALDHHRVTAFVLDPVMVATSGDPLLDDDAVSTIQQELVPRARLVTPNLHEAGMLTGQAIDSESDLWEAARRLVEMGCHAALVKGGHLEGGRVVDVFWDGLEERRWSHPRIETRNTHGTGCTLSAACAAGVARGLPLVDAVDAAVAFVQKAMEAAPDLGAGNGPLNHFVPAATHPD